MASVSNLIPACRVICVGNARAAHTLLTLLIAMLLAGCSVSGALSALTPGGAGMRAGVPYGEHPRQRLDVFLPEAPASGVLIVFFFGGSWNRGSPEQIRFVGKALAARGHVVVLPDYRIYPEVRYPEFLQDSARAVRWAAENAYALGADPKRLVLAGHSAGAYNAAMLALDRRWLDEADVPAGQHVAAFVGLAGPYEFLPIKNPEVQPVFCHPDYPPGTQPITYVGADSPPAFLAVAPEDSLVDPQRNSGQLAAALRAAGVDARYETYPRTSHVLLVAAISYPLRWLAPVLDDIDAFVRDVVQER
ncbi:MAG: alpha/beta hydrolase [Burkholderiaceae bacterium]